jgi:hypothetical protein
MGVLLLSNFPPVGSVLVDDVEEAETASEELEAES